MNSAGIWENVYLRCLEINGANDGTIESLKKLKSQLVSIAESIPDDTDPANQFEIFVMAKLCEASGNVVSRFLLLGDGEIK